MKPSLLAIELHHLGDGVLALPFLKAASEKYEVSVLCTETVGEMLKAFRPEVKILTAAEDWRGRLKQARGPLRARGFTITVCAWADTRCHLLARLTGAPQRVGFPTNGQNFYATHLAWRRRRLRFGKSIETVATWSGFPFLTDQLARNNPTDAHLQNWGQIAERLGLPYSLDTPWFSPQGTLPPELADFGQMQQPLWILHAGGRLPTKRWPLERYQELLAEFFAPRNLPVIIVQPPGEQSPEPVGEWQIRWPCSSHDELAAIIEHGDFFLGNDSYAAHVAAALGKKVVTIFGSGNPDWFAPYGQRSRACASAICPYHPCVDRCMMPDFVCLKDVDTAEVARQLKNM